QPDGEQERPGHPLREAARTRRRIQRCQASRLRHEVVVDRIEGIETRQNRVPPEERGQSEEVRPGLEHQADQNQDPDRAWLQHQGWVLIRACLRRGVVPPLLPYEIQLGGAPSHRGKPSPTVATMSFCVFSDPVDPRFKAAPETWMRSTI